MKTHQYDTVAGIGVARILSEGALFPQKSWRIFLVFSGHRQKTL